MPEFGFNRAEFSISTSDGRHCRLMEKVVFTRRDGRRVTLPVGTESDGASIPAVLWNSLPPFGKYWRAAFLHDAAYRCKTIPIIGTKAECDDLLLEAMELCNVEDTHKHLIHRGVEVFGSTAFVEDRI